jgi:DNA-binding transcriptional ArsR family regulator
VIRRERKSVAAAPGIRGELEQLKARVAALEKGIEGRRTAPAGEHSGERNPFKEEVDARFAELPEAARRRPIGKIGGTHYFRVGHGVYSGSATVYLDALLGLPSEALARSLAGLAHPARIEIYKALLERMEKGQDAASLLAAAGLNTTGQLYHHLREMEEVGLVVRRGRNLWAAENSFWFALAMTAARGLMTWRGEGVPEPSTPDAADAADAAKDARTPGGA